jgi:hypothetical protein
VKSMRSLGAVLLLAGIGVALFLYLPAPVDRGSYLDKLQRVAAPPDLQSSPAHFTPVARLGAFSPSIAPTMPARGETGNYARSETTQTAPPTAATAPASPTPATETQPGWQTVVSPAPATTPAVLPKTLSPTDPDARYKLVLDIQQQLRRVGCYWGRIDGSWGYATKDAMKDFTNRVNAALPIDQPDFVQLALVQSRGDNVCGACPAGQSLSVSGRCVGLPLTAQTKQPNAPQLATAPKEVLPWKAREEPAVQPLFKPVPTTVVSTEPLPDRMAIGGPAPTSVDVQQSAPPVTPGAAVAPPGATTAAPVTAAPKAERRARPDDRRGVAGNYHHEGPGTPRYNLLLSLGGLY